MRILIAEDEKKLCLSIAEGLKLDGYAVDVCFNGLDALEQVQVEPYDLVILDLNLPGLDGLEVLKALRQSHPDLKVLILSARAEIDDKVKGLDMGANDYLTKPFHFQELEARIRVLLRRKFVQEDPVLVFDILSFHTAARTATVNGKPLQLTRKETALLEYLLFHQDRVISQEEFMEHIWDSNANSFSNSIRVHISALRKKLKEALGYDPIINKMGQGYMLGGKKHE